MKALDSHSVSDLQVKLNATVDRVWGGRLRELRRKKCTPALADGIHKSLLPIGVVYG